MNDASNSHDPEDAANFISKITLWWIFPLLWKGYRKPLTHEDLYPIREVEKSKRRTELLEQKWGEEISRAKSLGRKPKLWRALLRYYSWPEYYWFLPIVLAAVLGDNLMCYGTIVLLHKLTSFYVEEHVEYSVYIYAIAFGCVMKQLGQNAVFLYGLVLGVRARAAILGLLYKKALRLSTLCLDSGHLMELVCNDSQRLFTGSELFILYGIRQSLCVISMLAWLLYFIGWSCIPSVLFLVVLATSRLMLNGFDYQLRKNASQLSGKRLGIIRNTLTAIYTLKLNCWEKIHEEKIQKTRWQEVKSKAKRWMIMLTTFLFVSCGQHMASFITILVLALTQLESIPNVNFFALLFLFRIINERLCLSFPSVIRNFTDVRSALTRVELFLLQNDDLDFKHDSKTIFQKKNETNLEQSNTPSMMETSKLMEQQCNDEQPSDTSREVRAELCQHKPPNLYLNEVSCKLAKQDPHLAPQSSSSEVLTNITFQRDGPGLVLICGPVGSGKTSLLATILGGELEMTSGSVQYTGTLAYVCDTPWVFPGTIRENILFYLPYNQNLYNEVIKACQLERDLSSFPNKDFARIGEHGGTLSGGQRTRIALARAVYSQADIYLLDDPLSSLDAKVAENIFRYCIQGLLSGKIVLLTTHNTRHFHEADQILYLKEGKYEELKRQELDASQSGILFQERVGREENMSEVIEDEWQQNDERNDKETVSQDDEGRGIGRVSFKVYQEYFSYAAWPIVCFIVALGYFSGQGMTVVVDYKVSRLPEAALQGWGTFHYALLMYTLCLLAALVLLVLGTLSMFLLLMNAAYKVHNKMVSSVIKAPLSFHTSHPVGQILNRFSQDINNLDELLPFSSFIGIVLGTPAVATIILAVITNALLIIPILISIPAYYFLSKVFLTSSSDMKRLMSIAASPIYSHFSNTVNGIRNIRVYGRRKEFTDEVFRHIDEHHRAVLCIYKANCSFGNVLSSVTISLSTTIIIIVLYFIADSSSAGKAALSAVTIYYAVSVTHMIDSVVRLFGDVNSQMTSAERVLEYTRIQPESGQNSPETPPESWPNMGEIVAKDVSLRHYNGGPLALKNITFKINASEKIGIAGRTGAGKSSLIAALMRLAETQGEILIDGLNINDFNIASTRKCVSVISQSPTLINGTVRLNVDPLRKHSDVEIWNALHRTGMSSTVKNTPKALDSELSLDNSSFSVGEKQLLSLARVLLQDNKIVIFDEATGKIDENTDKEIQRIIKEDLRDCTIITISHRLDTILNCDRVMVLDQGEIKEFDNVSVLLSKPDGLLKQLEERA